MPYIDESVLDDQQALDALDSRQTLRALATAGAQVRHAVDLASEARFERLTGGERPRSVLVAALGGSAVIADVLELLAEPHSPVPVQIRRNLPLPGWVGSMDLVVAVSQSGHAEGPVALAAEAGRRGAALLTSGAAESPLANGAARARGIPISVPGGARAARTAVWAMLTPVLLGAHALGMVDASPDVMARVADRLDEQAGVFRPSSESFVNPAKTLACELAEGVPVVLGDGPLTGVAACRAAAMLARTARIPATWGELPDAASQVVSCFDGPYTDAGASAGMPRDADIFADPFLDGAPSPKLRLLLLRDDGAEVVDESTRALADAVARTARDAGVRVSEYSTEPGHPLERLAGHVALTDFAAVYLALGLGMDPGLSPHVADIRDFTGE